MQYLYPDKLRTAAHACTTPATDWVSPKRMVRSKTRTAIQKVYHCTFLRSSYHHSEIVFGSDSSKVCFNTVRRSLQYLKCSICLFDAFRGPYVPALGSNPNSFCCLWNQVLEVLSADGMRRPRVHIVSSIKPSGKIDLSVQSGKEL